MTYSYVKTQGMSLARRELRDSIAREAALPTGMSEGREPEEE